MSHWSGQQVSTYLLIRRLAENGMTDVYLGEHVSLKTLAAIEVAHSPGQQENLAHQARILSHLHHPNVIGFLEYGTQGDISFLITDYSSHGSLNERHSPGSVPMPLPVVRPYVRQVTAALAYLHTNHIIHRNPLPPSLLLRTEHEIMLGGFCWALLAPSIPVQLGQERAFRNAIISAPEELHQRSLDFTYDQYLFGLVVYRWLTGNYPFRGNDILEIAMKHLTTPPPSMRKSVPLIPESVEQVVFRTLAKDPRERYRTMSDFAAAFEAACADTSEPQ